MLRLRNLAVSKSKDLVGISHEIARSFRNGIVILKQISRMSGYNSGVRELVSADPDYTPGNPALQFYLIDDLRLSKRYADNFAALWLKKASESLRLGLSFRESVRTANRESIHRLELISTTESSKAYSEGKSEAGRDYDGNLVMLKVWDSTMDNHACHECAFNHGETALVSEKFSFGEPGSVHPNCRCTYSVYTDSEIERIK